MWPNYSKQEANKVKEILLSNKVNYWTGQECKKFEEEFAKWSDCKFAISLSNGSVALELALKSLDLKPSDEVIVTPRSFIASVTCVLNAGAKPIFSDIDFQSGNLNAELISEKITSNTKAIICVHIGGIPCDMDPIMKLAKKNNLIVIEDASQAHGAKYNGKSVGSIGDIGTWSFCQDKIITTGGEGGMITTNNKNIWKKIWSMKDHGKNYDLVSKKPNKPGFRWLHSNLGSNFRMTEMQAAIGRIQLTKMTKWTNQRLRNAKILLKELNEFQDILSIPITPENSVNAYYRLYAFLKIEKLKKGWNREKLIEELNKKGTQCFTGSCSEIYLEKIFKKHPSKPKKRLNNSKKIGDSSICFLVDPGIKNKEIKKDAANIKNVLRNLVS
tara:strand:+ start:171 stop:1328 length:1158 start_codon:yes stop_codon:yes gene_type:complete